jgi:hypothetical protein
MDKETEEIKRLMLAAAQEAVIREVWNIRKPTGAAGRKRQ